MLTKIHLLRFLCLGLLISLLSSGCGPVAGTLAAAASTTVPPTSKPQPTASSTPPPTVTLTSTPTNTPTLVPTSTPDHTATTAAQVTRAAEATNALLAPDLEGYGVDPASGHVVMVYPGSPKIELTSYMETGNWLLKEAGSLSDFVVQSEITWKTSGALALCGITFHAQDDLDNGLQNRFFMMRLQFDPAWTIWRWENGKFQSFVSNDWLPSNHIHDKNSSTNVVALVVKGKDIDIFINRHKENRVEDSKLKEGLLALSAFQESGSTTCQFDKTWVWAFDK